MVIMTMGVRMIAKNVLKLAKLAMEEITISVKVVKVTIIGNFYPMCVCAVKDIIMMDRFSVINAITHGFIKNFNVFY